MCGSRPAGDWSIASSRVCAESRRGGEQGSGEGGGANGSDGHGQLPSSDAASRGGVAARYRRGWTPCHALAMTAAGGLRTARRHGERDGGRRNGERHRRHQRHLHGRDRRGAGRDRRRPRRDAGAGPHLSLPGEPPAGSCWPSSRKPSGRSPSRSPSWRRRSRTPMPGRSSAFCPTSASRATTSPSSACTGRRSTIAPRRASRASSASATGSRPGSASTSICRFRHADVASGGEGAPFAPLYHRALASDLPQPLMVLNLGGVGNVTYHRRRRGDRLRHRPGERASGRLPPPPPRRSLRRGRAARRFRPGRSRRWSRPSWRTRIFDRPAPKSLDRNDFHRRAAGGRSALRRGRGGDALRLHDRVRRRRAPPRPGPAAALARHGRRAAQRLLHGQPAPASSARRSTRSRRSAGTATTWKRSASAFSPSARRAACP